MSEWVAVQGCARYIVICVMYMSLVILHVIGDVDITVIVKDTILGAYEVRAPRSLLVFFHLPSLLRIQRDQQVTSDCLWSQSPTKNRNHHSPPEFQKVMCFVLCNWFNDFLRWIHLRRRRHLWQAGSVQPIFSIRLLVFKFFVENNAHVFFVNGTTERVPSF